MIGICSLERGLRDLPELTRMGERETRSWPEGPEREKKKYKERDKVGPRRDWKRARFHSEKDLKRTGMGVEWEELRPRNEVENAEKGMWRPTVINPVWLSTELAVAAAAGRSSVNISAGYKCLPVTLFAWFLCPISRSYVDIYHVTESLPGTIRHDMDQLPAGVNMEPHQGELETSMTLSPHYYHNYHFNSDLKSLQMPN